jgi:hypothetical protein
MTKKPKYVRYNEWLDENPGMVDIGVRLCQRYIADGQQSYSGQTIGHRFRWHVAELRGVDEFKVNNDFLPYLTRDINLALGREFCKVRGSDADADMDYRRRMAEILNPTPLAPEPETDSSAEPLIIEAEGENL